MQIYLFWIPKIKVAWILFYIPFSFLNNQDGFGEGFMMEY